MIFQQLTGYAREFSRKYRDPRVPHALHFPEIANDVLDEECLDDIVGVEISEASAKQRALAAYSPLILCQSSGLSVIIVTTALAAEM